jgi:hypothetical protein
MRTDAIQLFDKQWLFERCVRVCIGILFDIVSNEQIKQTCKQHGIIIRSMPMEEEKKKSKSQSIWLWL